MVLLMLHNAVLGVCICRLEEKKFLAEPSLLMQNCRKDLENNTGNNYYFESFDFFCSECNNLTIRGC